MKVLISLLALALLALFYVSCQRRLSIPAPPAVFTVPTFAYAQDLIDVADCEWAIDGPVFCSSGNEISLANWCTSISGATLRPNGTCLLPAGVFFIDGFGSGACTAISPGDELEFCDEHNHTWVAGVAR